MRKKKEKETQPYSISLRSKTRFRQCLFNFAPGGCGYHLIVTSSKNRLCGRVFTLRMKGRDQTFNPFEGSNWRSSQSFNLLIIATGFGSTKKRKIPDNSILPMEDSLFPGILSPLPRVYTSREKNKEEREEKVWERYRGMTGREGQHWRTIDCQIRASQDSGGEVK